MHGDLRLIVLITIASHTHAGWSDKATLTSSSCIHAGQSHIHAESHCQPELGLSLQQAVLLYAPRADDGVTADSASALPNPGQANRRRS